MGTSTTRGTTWARRRGALAVSTLGAVAALATAACSAPAASAARPVQEHAPAATGAAAPAAPVAQQVAARTGSTGTTATSATSAGSASAGRLARPYDLDGDGKRDQVQLNRVEGLGWSFDVHLTSQGDLSSAPLEEADAVVEDVAVLGSVDLDRDGRAEVLVRTLRAASGGDDRVVFRFDRGGVWLVRDAAGRPWHLSTSGSTAGPRGYDCRETVASRPGREVRTVSSTRDGSADSAPTYSGAVRTWSLSGHTARVVRTAPFRSLPATSPTLHLDLATCAR